ncbi:MAG TPA: hypothetical protein VIG40_01395 [Tissierellaceae bacterium]
MKKFIENLFNSLFIVAVFSFVTMGVCYLTDSVPVQLAIYFVMLVITGVYNVRD